MASINSFHSHTKRRLAAFSRSQGSADGSDYAGGGGKRIRGSSMGSSVLAKTRNPVTTPQCLVNVTAIVPKNEKQIRALAARGDVADLYSAPTGDDSCLAIHKGMVVAHRAKPNASFRTNASADSNVECVGSTNGLSISGTEFFMLGVAQTGSSPADKDSNNQVTVAIHGLQTVVNYCDERIEAGDQVILDPFGCTVTAQGSNEPRPIVYGPVGISERQFSLVLRPMNASHLSHFICAAQDAVRLRLGLPATAAKLAAITTSEALLTLLHQLCDDIFAHDMVVSPMHPIRGYAVIWAANRYCHMIQIESGSLVTSKTKVALTSAEYGNLLRVALLTKLRACIEVEDKFMDVANAYAMALPHGGDRHDATGERARSSLHSTNLAALLDQASPMNANPGDRPAHMREANARIAMHTEDAMENYVHRIRGYFGSLHFGVAMSSADKGQSYDVFVGRNR